MRSRAVGSVGRTLETGQGKSGCWCPEDMVSLSGAHMSLQRL